MTEVYVDLKNPAKVQSFVKTLTKLDGQFDLINGKHILDARSLMGIFSMNLSRPILLKVYDNTQSTMNALAPFLAKEQS